MEKLTNLFGSKLEYIGELCKTDKRITQNPAFLRSVNVAKDGVSIFAGDVEVSNCYDRDQNYKNTRVLGLQVQPSLIVDESYVQFIEKMPSSHFGTIEFFVDAQGYLHKKQIMLEGNCINVISSIYDEHGVELQRDMLTDAIPSAAKQVLAPQFAPDMQRLILRGDFVQFQFDCALNKKASYKQSKKTHYQRYLRDMDNIEIVHMTDDNGLSLRVRLDLGFGLTTMLLSDNRAHLASKEELAESIALEENEETRNALIGYCATRGITKDKVLAKLP